VYVFLMNDDGTIKSQSKITNPTPTSGEKFGFSLAAMGDADGNGVPDLLVGSPFSDYGGGTDRGAVWLCLLNADGTLLDHEKYGDVAGFWEITGLEDGDGLGMTVADVGDLDGNGFLDFAVGTQGDDDGGTSGSSSNVGAIRIVFLKAGQRVESIQKISDIDGGFGGSLNDGDWFGRCITNLGDLDGDLVTDLLVGAIFDDTAEMNAGAVWVLFLNDDGTVKDEQHITEGVGSFVGDLDDSDRFGGDLATVGDLNGDGIVDVAVSAKNDDDGGSSGLSSDVGAVWVLFLDTTGLVKGHQKISATDGNLPVTIADGDIFGECGSLGDLDGDGRPDLLASATGAAQGEGLLYVLFLDATVPPQQASASPFIGSIEGRGARAAFGRHPPPPGDDYIPKPFVPVPKTPTDDVSLLTATVTPDAAIFFDDVAEVLGSTVATSDGPVMASTSDMDGDGGDDILTADKGGGVVSYFESDGLAESLAFKRAVTLTPLSDTAPVAVLPGKMNAGDDLDVVVAGDDGVTLFASTAPGSWDTGTFTAVNGVSNPSLHTDLALLDFDNDGDLDVATSSGAQASGMTEQGFATILQNTSGALSVVGTLPINQAVASVLAGDFDNTDTMNWDDLLLAVHELDGGPSGEPQTRLELWVSNGNGTFALSGSAFTGTDNQVPSAEGIVPTWGDVGDIDNDGDLDAIYASEGNFAYAPGSFGNEYPMVELTLLLNDGSGGFSVSTVDTPYCGRGANVLLEDIAPAPPASPDDILEAIIVWYEDQNAGTADPPSYRTYVAALVWDDLLQTFVAAAPNQYLSGNEPGDGTARDVIVTAATDAEAPLPPNDVIELLVPNMVDNSVTVFSNDGKGKLSVHAKVPNVDDTLPIIPGIPVGGPRALQMIDVDGDSHEDAVTYNLWRDASGLSPDLQVSATVLLGDSNGSFTKSSWISLGNLGGEMALGDFDGDGRGDLVITQRENVFGQHRIEVLQGQGGGSFAPWIVETIAVSLDLVGGVTVLDIGGDGSLEIAVAAVRNGGLNEDDGRLIILSDIAGSLDVDVQTFMAEWGAIRSLVAADVDEDGNLDLLLGGEDGKLRLLVGDGLGDFTGKALGSQARNLGGGALQVGDVTGDGHLDILSSAGNGGGSVNQAYVRLLRGNGAGGFDVSIVNGFSSTSAVGSLRPMIADMNGDGALDTVLMHGGKAGGLSLLPNPLSDFESLGGGQAGTLEFVPRLLGRGYTTPSGTIELKIRNVPGMSFGVLHTHGGLADVLDPIWSTSFSGGIPLLIPGPPGVEGAGKLTISGTLPGDYSLVGASLLMRFTVLGYHDRHIGSGGGGPTVGGRPGLGGSAGSLGEPGKASTGGVLDQGLVSVAGARSNLLRMTITDGN
jgi:hypothetical protein